MIGGLQLVNKRPNADMKGLLLPPFNRDQGMLVKSLGEGRAIATAINGQGSAGRHSVDVCRTDHQRAQPAKLLLQ